MIVALIGTPSPLTYLATNVLRALAQVVRGEHHVIGVNAVADLRKAWPARENRMSAVLVASDMPEPELVGFLVQAKTPLVVCIEPLDAVANYMMGARGLDPLSALRIATRALSGLEGLAADPPPSALRFAASSAPLSRVLGDLLRFCHDEGEPETIARVAAYLGFEGREDRPFSEFLAQNRASLFPVSGQPEALDQKRLDAMAEVSRGYAGVAAGQRLREMLWPGVCFLQADTPGLPMDGELEMEGRARFLSHGPYFYLPPGRWEAEVAIEVSSSLSENRIGLDVFCGGVVAACTATLPSEGALACDFVFEVVDLARPVEFRIQLLSGAIEGRLKLHGVRLRRR